MEDTEKQVTGMEEEYILFGIEERTYGIAIGKVQEILTMQPISPMPNTLPFCKGVINIRGTIAPIIDLRLKLGFEALDYNERTCIMVLMLDGEEVGVIVDGVRDVVRISQEQLQNSPTNDAALTQARSYTTKVSVQDGMIWQILDLARLFDLEEAAQHER